ncbi:MAG: flavodoxin family protein [Clostridiaceae bacterium]
MKLIIHDLSKEQAERILPKDKNICVISDNGKIHHCMGCFGCWIKTPAECAIKDDYSNTGELLSKCDELIIISQCFYGGFSPFVKNVIDRGISYVHPYFVIRNDEMHHRRRYDNHINLHVCFYGANITEKEKRTAEDLVHANSVNFGCNLKEVLFASNAEEFGGKL